MADEPVERIQASITRPHRVAVEEEIDLNDSKLVTPFQVIRRGEDTIDSSDRVSFADYSPVVLPSDTPEEVEVDPAPKADSAPAPASSPVLTKTTEQQTSEQIAQAEAATLAADLADGESNPKEPSKPSSSGNQKNGPKEQPA